MTVTQYIGARYVPLFADPIQWDTTKEYEPLTIVLYEGNSYTSRQAVPAGISITNEIYWAQTGNYNAQVEQYRTEVRTFDGRITENSQLINECEEELEQEIEDRIAAVSNETQARIAADAQILDNIEDIEEKLQAQTELIYIGDSWGVNSNNIMPVTLAKMLNCKLHNFAVSNMGFVQGATNFQIQAKNAVNDNSINADKVRYIIIVGGTNDFSHGITNDDTLATAVKTICDTLQTKFKNAEIHIAYNVRFMYGSTVYPHINEQIKIWNELTQRLAYRGNIAAIPHPESVAWMSKSQFSEDGVHLTETTFKYWAQYLASAITSGNMCPDRTNVTTVSLDGYEGVSGNAYHYFDERSIWVEIYLHVLSDQNATHGIKTQDAGLFPVELFVNPEPNKTSNHITIPMVRADGKGNCNISVNFSTNATGRDTIYMLPISEGATIPAGYYFGYSKFRTFPTA